MELTGIELARRLEQAELAAASACFERWVAERPHSGSERLAVAGGVAFYYGSASPLSQALHIGMSDPVSPEEFRALEAFFLGRETPAVVSVCPYADPALVEQLGRRRFRISHFEHTLARPLRSGFDVRRATDRTEKASEGRGDVGGASHRQIFGVGGVSQAPTGQPAAPGDEWSTPQDTSRHRQIFGVGGLSQVPTGQPAAPGDESTPHEPPSPGQDSVVRPVNGEVEIAEATIGERPLWARTLMEGFADVDPVNPAMIEMFEVFAGSEGETAMLARIGGVPVGAAAMGIGGGVAMLFGDSTLPAWRKRGVHAALIAARLRRSAEAGCEWACAATVPGSPSQRNYERLGFRVAYTKAILVKDGM